MNENVDIRPLLVVERIRRGKTYVQLGEAIGFSNETIRRKLTFPLNKARVTPYDLSGMVKALGLSFAHIEFSLNNGLDHVPSCFVDFKYKGMRHLPKGARWYTRITEQYMCMNQLVETLEDPEGTIEQVLKIFLENWKFMLERYPELTNTLMEVLSSEELEWERKLRNDPTYLEKPLGFFQMQRAA